MLYLLSLECQFICLRLELLLHFVPVQRLFIAETGTGSSDRSEVDKVVKLYKSHRRVNTSSS